MGNVEKKGNTKTEERITLLKKFREIFPKEKIKYISGDREFVGKKWLSHLLGRKGMQFRVRIKESDRISSKQGLLKGSIYFAHLRVGEYDGTSRIQKTEYPWYMAFSDILSPILSGYKPKGPPTTQILFPAIQSVL